MGGMAPPPPYPHAAGPHAAGPHVRPAGSLGGGPTQSATQRIDPAQIPRPPHDAHAETVRHDTRHPQSGAATHPPPATSAFAATDAGACNPRYVRSTMSTIPNTGDLLHTSGMPLTILVQPLAVPHPDEEPIHVVDNGEAGPVRCARCKAYMNPFARWVDHGRFACNFCQHVSECPREYMCNVGPDGRRVDWQERPELCRGSVEYAAPSEYMVRPPMAPAVFFCVDVNPHAVQTGATTSACEAILRTLDSIPHPERTLVGLCTFDHAAHFYKFPGGENSGSGEGVGDENADPKGSAKPGPAASQTKMLVVPDVAEPYAPLPSGLALPLAECKEAFKSTVGQIAEMFATSRPGSPAGTAAIKSCVEALKPVGGKVLAFVATMPSGGYGAAKANRSAGPTVSASATAKEAEKEPLKHMAPVDKTYQKMAQEAAEYQVAIDVFALCAGGTYVDVASLGHLPRVTGGSFYRYPNFDTQLDFAQLHNDLRWNLMRPQGLEAVMRVRASAGLGVSEYGGYYCKRTPTDVDLPALDCDKTIAAHLRFEEKLQDGQEAYVQCALLYTTTSGHRRIRVHTMALPITSVLGNVFRAADLEAQTCDLVRRASQKLLSGTCSLHGAKEAALQTTVSTLHAYRKFCASNNSTGQLILPEALKVLPLYCLALHKSDGLRSDAGADERASWLLEGLGSSPATAVPSIYPRNFPVRDLNRRADSDAGDDNAITFPPLPHVTWLSAEKLEQDQMYLLEDGRELFVWVGRTAPAEALRDVFGVDHVDKLSAASTTLPSLDTGASKALNAFVNCVRKQRSRYMRTRVIKRGDPAENQFYRKLIEDRSPAGMNYVEFLCHVHRLIQNKFH